jgi:hypothetical protein
MSDFSALLGFEDRTKLMVPTLNEKAGAAKPKGESGKLFVTLPGINPIPFDNAINDRYCWRRGVAGAKPTGEEFPEGA